MKKFLFTLATLIAAGFALNAANVVLEVNGATELTPDPGTNTTVRVKLSALEGVVAGVQFDYVMQRPDGSVYEDLDACPVKIASTAAGYFTPMGMSKLMGNGFGSSIPDDAVGTYRGLIANTSKNIVWTTDYTKVFSDDDIADLEDQGENWQSWFALGNVWSMRLAVGEMPADQEYVLVKFGYWKFSMDGEPSIDGTGMENMDIKVMNKNYNPGGTTEELTGTITIGGENNNYVVPINVNIEGTYDLVVTVAKDGGAPVTVVPDEDGNITLGAAPEYGTYVINATATGNGDYEGTISAEEKTIVIDQLKKDDPVITFDTAADGTVTINIEGATRYTVTVNDQPYDGLTVAPIYDATQTIFVEAWNEADMYIAGHATNTATVAEKPYAPAVNPVITFVPGETGVTINVEPATSWEVIVDGQNMGQINFVEKTWTEQQITVNAVNEPEHQLKGEATNNYTLAAKPNMELEGPITISGVDQETGKIFVSYEGTENLPITLTATINNEPVAVENGYIQLPTYGTYTVVVTATTTEEHYNALVSDPAERTWEEPGTADKPVITFNPGQTGVTITVEPATSWEVIVDNVNMGQINFVEKTWAVQHIVVNATNAPTGVNPNYETGEYDLAAKDPMTFAGDIIFGAVEEDGRVYVQYTGEEEITSFTVTIVEYTRDVQTIDGKAGYVQLPGYGMWKLTAAVEGEHYVTKTEDAIREWLEPETTTDAPEINAGLNNENLSYDITATGGENDEVVLHVTWYDVNGDAHNETITGTGSASFSLPQTTEVQYISYWASAQNPNDDNPGVNNGDQYVEVPAAQQTGAPAFQQDAVQGQVGQWITINPAQADPNSTIYYRYATDGGNFTEWMEYTGTIPFTTPGTYVIEAYAKADGKLQSTDISLEFSVSKYPTSIEELMSAKDVAGVRYYNLAGQQMQNINGITIVVVSYTDGSNVTMKVMK